MIITGQLVRDSVYNYQFVRKKEMTTWFSVLLVVAGLVISASIWAINLKVHRFERFSRMCALFGPFVLLVMFMYSIYFIKGAYYSWLMLICLSLGITIAWLCAGALLIGVLIILAVGGYWLVVTLRDTNYAAFRRRFRRDFSYGWRRIKAWIEGEE